MSLTSFDFLLFAAAVLLLYYLIPGKAQWGLLLIASYFFYFMADPRLLFFLVFTTITTYIATAVMGKRQEVQKAYLKANREQLTREERTLCKKRGKRINRIWMLACLILNFTLLAFCKACLIEPLQHAISEGRLSFLAVGLPMGISFYMFQSMGYVIDVYREKAEAEKNPLKLALFVSFFPQLIQGPISKFNELAPALFTPTRFDGKQVSFGLQRMLWGYFKKMVIADRLAAAVIALRGPDQYGAAFALLTVFYAVQLYADFTGGIDIAIGLSEAMGIHLPENFIRPFFSKNIAEYWRRWHRTLGTWMKDYVFYPLTVSRPLRNLTQKLRKSHPRLGKRLPVYIATVLTWFVTGIWHGFSPNFIVWGMLNCAVIIISEELTPLYEKFHSRFGLNKHRWYDGFQIVRMFLLMNLIRACDLFPHVGDYFYSLGTLLTVHNWHILWDGTLMTLGLTGLDYGIVLGGIALMFTVSMLQRKKQVRERLWEKPVWLRYSLTFLLLAAVVLLGHYGIGYDAGNFIYNQF